MKIITLTLPIAILAAAITSCGTHTVHEGDWVTVQVATPNARPQGRSSFTSCDMPVSRLIATSEKFGTVTTDMPATYDDVQMTGAGTGDPVLTFNGNKSISVQASDDWVFSYVGVHSSTCGTSTNLRLSFGETGPVSVMGNNTLIPMTIVTDTGTMFHVGVSGVADPSSNMTAVTLHIPTVQNMTNCSTNYSLALEDGTVLLTGAFSFGTGGSAINPAIAPLPTKTKMVLTINDGTGTFHYPFTSTTGSSPTTINMDPQPNFCP
jgi:hypothetical protein